MLVALETSGQGRREQSGLQVSPAPDEAAVGFKLTVTQLEYHPKQVITKGQATVTTCLRSTDGQGLAGSGLTAGLHVPKICGDKKMKQSEKCLCHLCLCLALLESIDTAHVFSSEHVFLGRVSSPTEIPSPPV